MCSETINRVYLAQATQEINVTPESLEGAQQKIGKSLDDIEATYLFTNRDNDKKLAI